jgi:hypothetical protein
MTACGVKFRGTVDESDLTECLSHKLICIWTSKRFHRSFGHSYLLC